MSSERRTGSVLSMSRTKAVMPPWVNTPCGSMPPRQNAAYRDKKQTASPLFVNLCPVCLRSDHRRNFLAAAMQSGFMEQAMRITCRYACVQRPASSESWPQSQIGYSWIGSSYGTSKQSFSAHGNSPKPISCTFRPSAFLRVTPALIGFLNLHLFGYN